MSLFDTKLTNPVAKQINMLTLSDSYEIEILSDNLLKDIQLIDFKENQLIVFSSKKGFDIVDLLQIILDKIGSCDIIISTYAISELSTRKLFFLKQAGKIRTLNFLLDKRNIVHKEAALQFLKNFSDSVIIDDNHSKVTVLKNKIYNISIISSMNYTRNPRMESGVIINSESIALFNEKWILKK